MKVVLRNLAGGETLQGGEISYIKKNPDPFVRIRVRQQSRTYFEPSTLR